MKGEVDGTFSSFMAIEGGLPIVSNHHPSSDAINTVLACTNPPSDTTTTALASTNPSSEATDTALGNTKPA